MIVCRHRKSSRYKLDLVNNCPGNPNPDLALDSTMRSRGLVERKVTGFGDEQVMDLAKLDDIAMRRTNRVAGRGRHRQATEEAIPPSSCHRRY